MNNFTKLLSYPAFVIVVIILGFSSIILFFQLYTVETKKLLDENANALGILNSWEILQSSTKNLIIADDLPSALEHWGGTIKNFDNKINGFISSEIIQKMCSENPEFKAKITETDRLWSVIKPRIENVMYQFNAYFHEKSQTEIFVYRSLLHELLYQIGKSGHSFQYMILFDLTYDIEYMVSSLNQYFVNVLEETVEMIDLSINKRLKHKRFIAFSSSIIVVLITIIFISISQKALAKSKLQLKMLSGQLINDEEDIRKKLTHELHDEIGQALTAIKFSAENILNQLRKNRIKDGIDYLESLIVLTQDTIAEARKMSVSLRPAMIDQLGVLATTSWFCREYQKIYPHIYVTTTTEIEEKDIPSTLKIVIYRIIQECLTNIAKHSKAYNATVLVKKNGNRIEVSVTDNGIGFDYKDITSDKDLSSAMGLITMRERTEITGGEFSIKSEKGKGTTVRAFWAIQKE